MKSAELSRGRTRQLVKKINSPAQFSIWKGKTRVLCLVLCWVSGAENKSPFSAEQRLQVKWIYWKHRVSEQGMNQEIVCIFRERRCRFNAITTFLQLKTKFQSKPLNEVTLDGWAWKLQNEKNNLINGDGNVAGFHSEEPATLGHTPTHGDFYTKMHFTISNRARACVPTSIKDRDMFIKWTRHKT